jgi:hypothetical protein
LQANDAGVGFAAPGLPSPPIPAGVHFQAIANNVDPSVSIPSVLHVGADGTLTVPVNLDDGHPEGSTGLIEAHLALTYDPRQFSMSAGDIHLGSVLAAGSGWSVVPTVDQATGQIAIALSSSTPISSSLGGSLVTIDFHHVGYGEPSGVSRRVPGPAAIALVASVSPNGQYVATELEDAQGSFVLTPAPRNGFDSQVDSVVFLTATPATPAPSSATEISTTAPIAFPADDLHTVATPVGESNDREFVTGPAAPTDTTVLPVSAVSAHGAAAIVAATGFLPPTGILSASPLTGLMFQIANLPVVNASGSPGMAPWQHLENQLVQALMRAPASPNDPTRTGTVNTTLERALASQLLLCQPASDYLDMLDGEVVAKRAALDQYFARTADDTDQIVDEESGESW